MNKVIEINHLYKNYGEVQAVKDLNLTIEKGEMFAFIGPNGAGKSTTIRTCLGLIKPSSGKVKIFGEDILNNRDYLKDIGYMSSEAMFYGNMRVKEIISFSANLRKKDCSRESKILCEKLDLDINKKIDELSLGNRKKVAIVCAMQHSPKLYVFDEPTSGLDPLIQKVFFDLLKEKNHEGATIFLSSHVLSEVQNNCTKAAIIKEGRIIACDNVDTLSKTTARRVTLQGVTDIPETINAKSIQVLGNSVNFLYQGEIKALLSRLEPLPITDLTITEPELEEVFMHYYQKEDEKDDSF